MNSKGDGGYQQDAYLINSSERIVIERLPGPLEQFSAASPAAKTLIILFVILSVAISSIMDFFNLRYGGVASEQQLALGKMVKAADITGPEINYWGGSFEIIQSEAARRDNRIRSVDVTQMTVPERYAKWYGTVADKRSGYVGNGRFQWFFNYLVPTSNGKYETVYGYGIVRLVQQPMGIFVQQRWVIEKIEITYRR